MRPQIVKTLASVLCFFACTIMLGQTAGGSSGPPAPSSSLGPCPGPAPCELGLPLDTNILILLFVGLAYGGYIAFIRLRAKNIPV